MPHGLKRFQQSGQSHFVTFTCYHRRCGFDSPAAYDLFLEVLESMRRRFTQRVYGFVVMPEDDHLLLSEPERTGRLEVEQFSPLCVAASGRSRNRVGMDGARTRKAS